MRWGIACSCGTMPDKISVFETALFAWPSAKKWGTVNLIKKLLPLSVVGLALAPAAHAVILSSDAAILSNPVTTLTYTGNPFTTVTAPYTTSDYISATFVFDGLLPQNADLQLLTLSSFSVTDQHQTFTPANADPSLSYLRVTTDSAANIFGWSFQFVPINGGLPYILSYASSGQAADGGLLMSDVGGQNLNTPGQWQVSVDSGGVVPEPTTLALLGLGLAGAGVARLRKKKA
jgi:hypothetical protein